MKRIILALVVVALVLGSAVFGNFYGSTDLAAEIEQLQTQNVDLAENLGNAEAKYTDVHAVVSEYFTLSKTMGDDFDKIQETGKAWYESGDVFKLNDHIESINLIIEHDQDYIALLEDNQTFFIELGMDVPASLERMDNTISGWEKAIAELSSYQ